MIRLVRQRREPLVPCSWLQADDPTVRSCGAWIPHAPRKACPNCGQVQIRATAPVPGPDATILEEDGILVDEESGEIVATHIVNSGTRASAIAQALRTTTWEGVHNEGRMSGIAVMHQTFGFATPSPLRKRWACTRCRFDRNHPDAATRIYEFVEEAERQLRQYAPSAYRHSIDAVTSKIPATWRIAGTPWTSGIINNTAALPYHKDSGNVAGSWSAMIAARRGVEGGLLHLADYDVYLAVPHGSISIFDGQSVLHGVTPFRRVSSDAYRYTIVVYAKAGMTSCDPDPLREAERAARRLTEAGEVARRKRNVGS